MLGHMVAVRPLNLSKQVTLKILKRKLSDFAPVQLSYASYESSSSDPNLTPLVIHHGLFGSKSNWNSLCKAYHSKTHRKIIAVDARNHGDSPHSPEHTYAHLVSDLKALFTQLNLEKVILMGHSMGGRAVMYFALQYPSVVEKMIVADISPVRTSPNLRSMPGLFEVVQGARLPENVTMSVARAQVDAELAESISDKDLRSFLLTNLVRKTDGGYAWRINIPALLTNFDEMARFPQIGNMTYEKPVLFIGGGDSDYIKESDHPEILKLFPNAEFQYIEDAGHWLHSEKPTEFLKRTLEFLNRHQ